MSDLHNACERGHLDAVRLSLTRGADVDWPGANACTPFFIACFKGSTPRGFETTVPM